MMVVSFLPPSCAGSEAEAGVEDGPGGILAFEIEAVEKKIGVGSLLHNPYLHAVGSLVQERELKAVDYVLVIDLHFKLIEEQIDVADRIDVAVEVDVAVFEAIEGTVFVRLYAHMLFLFWYRAFAVRDPFRFEVKTCKTGIGAVFGIEYHPYGACIAVDVSFRI